MGIEPTTLCSLDDCTCVMYHCTCIGCVYVHCMCIHYSLVYTYMYMYVYTYMYMRISKNHNFLGCEQP